MNNLERKMMCKHCHDERHHIQASAHTWQNCVYNPERVIRVGEMRNKKKDKLIHPKNWNPEKGSAFMWNGNLWALVVEVDFYKEEKVADISYRVDDKIYNISISC